MPQPQTSWLIGLLSLALLVPACQPAGEPNRLLPQETAISQVATAALLTASPTATVTPSPTATPSPSATSTLAYTSQGDQLPTRSPTSPPTPTAIPAEEPVPSTLATRPLPTPTLAPMSEVDLPALEESLALLDRLERRKGKATPTLVGPITSRVDSYTDIGTCPPCEDCNNVIFSAEILMGEGRNVTGDLKAPIFEENTHGISFTGTIDSITHVYDFTGFNEISNYSYECTARLQAKLVKNGQKFEGIIDETCTYGNTNECGGVWTFSLDRK